MNADRWITRLIAITVCTLSVCVTVTACVLFFRQVAVPDPLDRLVTFLLGGLVGRLTASSSKDPLPVVPVDAPPTDASVAPLG